MTADERIEDLLNRFGQTLDDLPKPKSGYYTYPLKTKELLEEEARKWDEKNTYYSWDVVADYACRLADIIDKLEIALETAMRLIPCNRCVNNFDTEIHNCDFEVDDSLLSDISMDDIEIDHENKKIIF